MTAREKDSKATHAKNRIPQVYVSLYPVNLKCHKCGLEQVECLPCPMCDGHLVTPESLGSTSDRAKQAAKEVVERILGFNVLDDLATLPPEHRHRKHVESEVAAIMSRYLHAQVSQ